MLCSEDYEYATPNAAALMQSLRAFGYDTSTAVADLIDNSITAQASRIAIQFEWNDGHPWISIADNGYGMSEQELFEAMKTGSKNSLDTRDKTDLGRFGLGLKTASLSQCKRFTVASKTHKGSVNVRCWDLDIVVEKEEWILLKTASDTARKIIDKYFVSCDAGTIVIWEKIDKIIPDTHINDEDYQYAFLEYAQAVKEHISIVFSSYMHGQKKVYFEINDRPIDMWDPFMMDNSFTTNMPTEILFVNGAEVKIKSFILPHPSKLTPDEFKHNAGLHGWNAQQGFYIFRNNRLIVSGDWLLDDLEKLDQYRLARIRVDIGNETDDEWNLDVRKSIAVPPISIRKEIKRIAVAARKESSKIYRHRGKKLARKAKSDQVFVWHQNVRNGKLGYAINRNHPIVRELLQSDARKEIRQLLALIEETIPVPMIISDYSENEDKMLKPFEGQSISEYGDMIHILYDMYLSAGYTQQEAVENIANTEPYIYQPE